MEIVSGGKTISFDRFSDIYNLIFESRDKQAAEHLLNMQAFSSDEMITYDDISFLHTPILGQQVIKAYFFLGKRSQRRENYIDPQGNEHEIPRSFYYDEQGSRVELKGEKTDIQRIRGMFLPIVHFYSNERELREQFIMWLNDDLSKTGARRKELKKSSKIFDEAEKLAPKSLS